MFSFIQRVKFFKINFSRLFFTKFLTLLERGMNQDESI